MSCKMCGTETSTLCDGQGSWNGDCCSRLPRLVVLPASVEEERLEGLGLERRRCSSGFPHLGTCFYRNWE